jgi:hypothetical protein
MVNFPYNLCVDDHLTHQCPWIEESQKLLEQQYHVVLTNPFPQGYNVVQASSSTITPGGNQCTPALDDNTESVNVYMMREDAHLQTMACDYEIPKSAEKRKEAHDPLHPLHIDKTMGETVTLIPKGEFKKAYHNPKERVSHNYSVVEDLAQTPCLMSSMEVLHSFPSQRKVLLSALGATDLANSGSIIFYPFDNKPCFPHHVSFQRLMVYAMKSLTKNIFCMVVDKGASTCVMSLAFWKAIFQPKLSLSPTLLTAFDKNYF